VYVVCCRQCHAVPCCAVLQVLAVGTDVKLQVSAGDKVVFNKYAMAEVEVPDGDIIFVAEKSILAKLE